MLRAKGKGKQDWATPVWFFNTLFKYWNFTLDAAASKENAKLARFYTEEDDGLKQPWAEYGWTFCNPPYGNIKPWIEKAIAEQKDGHYSILVLPANGMTSKWYMLAREHCSTYIVAPRIKFDGPGKSPNGGVMLLEFWPETQYIDRFKIYFMHLALR